MSLNVSQQFFLVFFAIFWGTAANAWPKRKPFHWTFVLYSWRVAGRVVWSIVGLNIAPVLFFSCTLQELGQKAAASTVGWPAVALGVTPAFAVFGLYRLWIAGIELCPTAFYYRDESEMIARGKYDLRGVDPTITELTLRRKWWWANALFGVVYIAVAALVPRLFR